MNPPVWFGAAAVVVGFVGLGSTRPDFSRRLFQQLQSGIVDTFGWYYILVASVLLALVLGLAFSRFGELRLGPPDSEPEFRILPWFSMLLAAGMGIGIVYFGAAEPLLHFARPPVEAEGTEASLKEAMRFIFFHWGFHPWAIYTSIALPLAYLHFRHDLPLAPRSLLHPLIGERMHGWPGHVVDILCTAGTLFGVATSLGLGAIQINGGLNHLFDVPVETSLQIGLIAGITAVATISVVTGLKGGIRFLSTFNICLAGLILLFVLVTGPTIYLLDLFVTSIGYYLQKLPETSFYISPGSDGGWQSQWTLFYWSWWISWSPFVGVFVARISRGRTVREFIIAALLVPSIMGFFWFSVLGGTGLHAQIFENASLLSAATDDVQGSTLFAVLKRLPLQEVTSLLAILLVVACLGLWARMRKDNADKAESVSE